MPDLTHDTAEDGFHEIQLSGKQLVFLFMATTVVSVAIFLCGVMVGRGVNAERGDGLAEAPAAAASPAASDQTGGPVSAEPPSPPAEDELSYHRRLQGTPAADASRPATQAADAPPEAPPPAAAPQADTRQPTTGVPTAGQKGTWVVQVTAMKNRSAAVDIVQRLIGKGYPAFLENPARGAPVIYRVRIGRYDERREAEQMARRLEEEEQFSPVVTR